MSFDTFKDPIVYKMRKGDISDPFVSIDQTEVVRNQTILLKEIPDEDSSMTITDGVTPLFTKKSGIPNVTTVVVDYTNGILTFDQSHNGTTFTVSFMGRGNIYLPSSKVYTNVDGTGEITETLQTLIDTTELARDSANQTDTNVQVAEAIRVTSETTRQNNETTRQSNETNRQTNETNRVTAETSRSNAETLRDSNETTRQSQESTRQTNETTRDSNETARQTNETTRDSNETARQTNETARISSENNREINEQNRDNAETIRQSNETTRQSQESTRQTDTANAITNVNTQLDEVKYVESYNVATTYKKRNIASFNGSSFISLVDNNVGNQPPDPLVATQDAWWALVGRKGTDGDGTVITPYDKFTATEGQKIFTLSNTYDQFQGRTSVYVDGVRQFTPEHYEETNSNTITLSEGVSAGVIVEVHYFSESVPLASDVQTTVDNHTATINDHEARLDNHELLEMFPNTIYVDLNGMTVGDIVISHTKVALGTVTLA